MVQWHVLRDTIPLKPAQLAYVLVVLFIELGEVLNSKSCMAVSPGNGLLFFGGAGDSTLHREG
jgi:hypothetical protein